MKPHIEPSPCVAAVCAVWIVLALPPVRALLESTMTLHMLVQLPLLAAGGFALGLAWRRSRRADRWAARTLALIEPFNAGGTTGILAAGLVMIWWMLPRGLDIARLDLAWAAAKFATVTVAGAAIAVSWPRMPAIARGVVHLELIATLLRFGWGYLAAPERLCVSYLDGDQQRAGALLLWFGAIYAAGVIWRPVLGGGSREPAHGMQSTSQGSG